MNEILRKTGRARTARTTRSARTTRTTSTTRKTKPIKKQKQGEEQEKREEDKTGLLEKGKQEIKGMSLRQLLSPILRRFGVSSSTSNGQRIVRRDLQSNTTNN